MIRGKEDVTEIKPAELLVDIRLKRLISSFSSIHQSRLKTSKKKKNTNYLIIRPHQNLKKLRTFYLFAHQKAKKHFELNLSAQWIIENRDELDEAVDAAKSNFTRKLFNYLPKSQNKNFKDLPRIYEIIYTFILEQKKGITERALIQYLQRVQKNNPLVLDEIFSLPLFFGFILTDFVCDNLWYIFQDGRARSDLADIITKYNNSFLSREAAKKIYDTVRKEGDEYSAYFFLHLRKKASSNSYLKELLKLAQTYILKNKAKTELYFSILHNRQVSKSVDAFLDLKEIDWDNVFKETSEVFRIFSDDPVQVFPRLDIISRSQYLDQIKKVSRRTKIPERKLAEEILYLAQNGKHSSERHVGYYLIDEGASLLEKRIGKHIRLRFFPKLTQNGYLLEEVFLLVIGYYLLYNQFEKNGFFLASILGFPILYFIVKQILDTLFSRFTEARKLPKIHYEQNLDPEVATYYVIPSFLSSKKDCRRLAATLETAFLGNRGQNIYYCLLLDHPDNHTQIDEQDEVLKGYMLEKIQELNLKYHTHNTFSFFLRDRIWSEDQHVWIGWERKRGKILEFLTFLRKKKTLSTCFFSLDEIPEAKYLITVDEDSTVPKNFVHEMVGTIAHPLNSAEYDEYGQLKRGYVIVQPRIDFSFITKNQSNLSKLLCDARGFDFYSHFINEISFDLFREGHYTGKGIIAIDQFLQKLDGLFRDHTILSHDLLEGAIVGTGYSSDIKLFEGFPSTVKSYFMRLHRWDRGDWQIINWLGRKIIDRDSTIKKNPLNLYQRSKILNNALYSLLPISQLAIFYFGGVGIINKELAYVLFLSLFLLLPLALGMYQIFSQHIFQFNLYYILIDTAFLFKSLLRKNLFDIIFLPYSCYLKIDAISKAIYRRYIVHKNVLQWTTFTASEGKKPSQIESYAPIFGPAWVGLILLLIVSVFVNADIVLTGFLIIWLFVPITINLYDRKMVKSPDIKNQEFFLVDTAWRTWDFFDTYTNVSTKFLPPDNVQGKDELRPTTYTSITNIGYYLLSLFSAYRLGFTGLVEFFNKLEASMTTINGLEKFRGHFYNWYDLSSLHPSKPWFISTVDSGNFLACLVTLHEALDHTYDAFNFNNTHFNSLLCVLEPLSLDREIQAIIDVLQRPVLTLKEYSNSINKIHSALKVLLTQKESLDSGWSTIKKAFDIADYLLLDCQKLCIPEIENLYRKITVASVKDQVQKIQNVKNVKELVYEYELLEMELKSDNSGMNFRLLEAVAVRLEFLHDLKQRKLVLGQTLETIINQMDFSFLFSKKHMALSIGYKVRQKRLEKYHYGILATESRLAVFLAIAKNNIPKKAWTSLKRQMRKGKKGTFLMSWSGTAFEYFMPAIFMRYAEESIYHQTYDGFIAEEKYFAAKHNLPWGFSESMYADFTPQGKYKYKAFGFADSALNPNVDKKLVVSPYSSFMSMKHKPKDSLENLRRLEEDGARGAYGFYESIDYSKDNKPQVIFAYMAHHQGMILTSLCNVIDDNILVKLFHDNKLVRSVAYLLEENKPGKVDVEKLNLKNLRYVKYEY